MRSGTRALAAVALVGLLVVGCAKQREFSGAARVLERAHQQADDCRAFADGLEASDLRRDHLLEYADAARLRVDMVGAQLDRARAFELYDKESRAIHASAVILLSFLRSSIASEAMSGLPHVEPGPIRLESYDQGISRLRDQIDEIELRAHDEGRVVGDTGLAWSAP